MNNTVRRGPAVSRPAWDPSSPRPLSQVEVAAVMGLSKRRIQQIEETAMKKIHKALAGQASAEGLGIREFLFGGDE